MNSVQRYETIRLDKVSDAPTGIRVDATVSSVGVFPYTNPDGSIRYEYRPPEEVFHPESLQSLRDAPVTLGHPPGLLTPKEWKKYAIGHVSGEPRADTATGQIHSELVISEGGAVDHALAKRLHELSGGYRCNAIPRAGITPEGIPGVQPGLRYDAVQTAIRYNHIGLGGTGWGRQGDRATLRLDGNGDQIFPDADSEDSKTMKLKFRIDGKDAEIESGSAEHLQLQARLDAVTAREAEIMEMKKRLDAITAERDGLATEKKNLQIRLDEAPKIALEQVKARLKLETTARQFLGKDARFDEKSDEQIRIAVIQTADKDFRADGKSEDYLAASFDFYTRKEAQAAGDRTSALYALNTSVRIDTSESPQGSGADERFDESNADSDLARERFKKRAQALYKQPLGVSKAREGSR